MVEIIAIDGPASVGKSTIARKISNYYKAPLLNSGRLYRAVAVKIQNRRIKINNKEEIIQIAKSLRNSDLNSQNLFTRKIDKIASSISKKKYLRNELMSHQRKFPTKHAKGKKFAVLEGRDIGTVIFPSAKYKIFMWADAETRAERRYQQKIKNGQKTSLNQIYKEIVDRDNRDLHRKIAPLKPAANSVLLDTTYLDIEQAFNAIKRIIIKAI